ncbi:MAG: hypothetical protein ACR2N6_05165 [Miltoncostaeaceae bacterium]
MSVSAASGAAQEALAIKMLGKSMEMAQQQMAAVTDPAMAALASQAAMQVVDVAAGQVDVSA